MTTNASRTVSSVDPLFDELLVTLMVGGDRRAGDRLSARWHPRLVRTARRLTGDGELAIGCAQEAWLAIWRGLPGLRDPARFGPWAFAILRHKCADAVGRRASERARDAAPPTQTTSAASADDGIALRQAFAALGPDHRLAAHLFFVEGLTLAEIAEVQAVPLGTAKSRLFHARRQLKAALSGDTP